MEYGIFLMFLNLGKLLLLDRYQVWRSHDPTSVYTFDFCEKKKVITLPSFILFKKTQLWVLCIYFLGSLRFP